MNNVSHNVSFSFRLMLRQDEIRSSLSNLQLSEDEFVRLRSTPVQQLTLQQYTSVRICCSLIVWVRSILQHLSYSSTLR